MSATSGVKLLAGDNPQIPKGFGDAPVAAYIAAVPGWKQGIVRAVDELVVSTIPGVKKAVKWNTPLYGLDGSTWFLSMHCFKTYVRLTFFNGTELDPMPEKPSKVPGVRYHDIGEAQGIDTDRLTAWINQAVLLPGEKL
ncbi:histidine kinase [Devosia sp. Leaf420]|uniref:DUF1801 domain-containing protein n=1 Tax=Devosia sp. Leaf420 TaxID=1736374 RepID=UPI00071509E2|nr:DUF1801 domain-containing protein [Devosia sp. Leaf420]KQT49465.1 histidine kinase [Devosia sp. Leaf420]